MHQALCSPAPCFCRGSFSQSTKLKVAAALRWGSHWGRVGCVADGGRGSTAHQGARFLCCLQWDASKRPIGKQVDTAVWGGAAQFLRWGSCAFLGGRGERHWGSTLLTGACSRRWEQEPLLTHAGFLLHMAASSTAALALSFAFSNQINFPF